MFYQYVEKARLINCCTKMEKYQLPVLHQYHSNSIITNTCCCHFKTTYRENKDERNKLALPILGEKEIFQLNDLNHHIS